MEVVLESGSKVGASLSLSLSRARPRVPPRAHFPRARARAQTLFFNAAASALGKMVLRL
jgi:hypothetical protein